MSDRADALDAALHEREIGALVVASPANLRWLTGFTGSNGAAVAGPQIRRFITDFRYLTQAADEVSGDWEQEIATTLLDRAMERLPDGVRLGFEDDHLTVKQHARLVELAADRITLVEAGGVVEELRLAKDGDEVDKVRAAARLADEALREVLERGIVGRTEKEVALDIEFAMRRRGASAASFPPIVAAGEHGALPHAQPRDEKIPAGTLVVIDWGCMLDGYASDCTRTFATGELDPRDREVYDLVRLAQEEALAAVRPGPTGREVDAVARDVIEAAGHGEHFGHSLGHGIGLAVHEQPRLAPDQDGKLAPGHVVTVEPGIYLPGWGGVRIEDDVLVTEEGCEVLTSVAKELDECVVH